MEREGDILKQRIFLFLTQFILLFPIILFIIPFEEKSDLNTFEIIWIVVIMVLLGQLIFYLSE